MFYTLVTMFLIVLDVFLMHSKDAMDMFYRVSPPQIAGKEKHEQTWKTFASI